MRLTDGKTTAMVCIYDRNGIDVANDLLADSIIGYMPESDTHIVSDMDHIIDALNPELSEIYGIESMETFYEEDPEVIPVEDIEFFTAKHGRDVSTIVANKGSNYDKLAKATHKWIDRHFDELAEDEQDYINGCDYDAVVDLFASCDSVDELKRYITEYKEEA